MAKVSIIVPIYGVEKYLRQAIDSLLSQTLKDIEILLINDGSKDSCASIIDEYANKDSRIVAIHKDNKGYGHTCNLGLEKATGEYIAILEPDDFIDEKMYEDLYELANENDADIVKSNLKQYDNKTQEISDFKLLKLNEIPKDVFTLKECPKILAVHPSTVTAIYKRQFLLNNNIKWLEISGAGWVDNLFQVQTMCLAQKIIYTPKAYYNWRIYHRDLSDELKDITLPFKRSLEIHKWLEEQQIDDIDVLACLYLRELSYIDMVFNKDNVKLNEKDYELIRQVVDKFDENIIKNSNYIKGKNLKNILFVKKNPCLYYSYCRYRKFRKQIINIRFSKNQKKITLFGKTWRFD